ncbi:MAG: hypothetical protein AAF810_04000 [Cyanobacteria bacterium P01_D01_bin.36]
MPKTLEEQLREEVQKRQQGKTATPKSYLSSHFNKKGRKILVGALSLGLLVVGVKTLYSPVNRERMLPTLTSPKSHLEAVAPPESGVLKQYQSVTPDETGIFRFFAREPVEGDRTSLSEGCETSSSDRTEDNAANEDGIVENENATGNEESTDEKRPEHYYVELLDWESDEVVLTAFVRESDMAVFSVPFGIYKIRYASGLTWYGETDLFGYRTLHEMTETLPKRTAQFEISDEEPGMDIGFHCSGGNLGRTPVDKDSSEKGIPVEPTDGIQSI